MFELVGAFVEAVSGYIGGRFATNKQTSFHISAICVALACGLIFFLAYGTYELFFPAPNPIMNIWQGLSILALIVTLII